MFKANCYNIMIVSPSDVIAEREICKNVIYEWNTIHSENKNINLNPIGWDINSYPEMGTHPQDILNKQLLDKADVLIGILWTRIGTKTKDYESGSIEEISKHTKSGKPALLYFSSASADPGSIDHDQYEKLKKYKKSIQECSFYKNYKNISEFTTMLRKDIQLLVNEKLSDCNEMPVKTDEKDKYSDIKEILSQLSNDAKIILKEASKDNSGCIMCFYLIGSFSIRTNNKVFGSASDNPRRIAALEEAINQLESSGLIKDAGNKHEVFKLTLKGYRITDHDWLYIDKA